MFNSHKETKLTSKSNINKIKNKKTHKEGKKRCKERSYIIQKRNRSTVGIKKKRNWPYVGHQEKLFATFTPLFRQ